jgi:multiple sugar transport system substrate-binding protein
MKQTVSDGVPRPVSPAYSDVSLAIQRTLHPPASVDPSSTVDKLKDKIQVAADGGIY